VAIISNATTIADAGAFASGVIPAGLILIKTLTLSNAATASFVHGSSSVVLDSTYPNYLFKFINMHPQTDDRSFDFQGSINAGSSYGVTITSSSFRGYNQEDGGGNGFGYLGAYDLTQSTSLQRLSQTVGNGNDESLSGEMYLFNPSNTTFVKHFVVRNSHYGYANYAGDTYTAGYFNTTSDIDAVRFQFTSGNIDSGIIKLYGIKGS
jgi:hypothetical protein